MSAKEHDCFFVFDNLLGGSRWARELRRRVIQRSSHRFNAVVTGPSGTGKRTIARSLHEHSPRRSKPFIPVDCQRLPGNLFRSQVFGHAHRETTTLGALRAADGGTIYFANVDRLDKQLQAELFHALETKSVTPFDGSEHYDIDVRVVAGSRNCLDEQVRDGRFRSDLFSRLSVISFETIPLRDRREDVVPIAKYVVAKLTFERGSIAKELSDEALRLLQAYDWPGNVNELRDVLDDAISSNEHGNVIEASDMGVELNELQSAWETLAELEANHIRETLAISCGDVERAAGLLGIEVSELERKLAES